MRGSEFLDKLEAAFPGILKGLYGGIDHDYSDAGDGVICNVLSQVANASGARLTAEVMAKARHRHGLVAFRQQRKQNGTAPDLAPEPQAPAPAEEQLPLAAAPAPQLSPETEAVVKVLERGFGALLSRFGRFEREFERLASAAAVREERV